MDLAKLSIWKAFLMVRETPYFVPENIKQLLNFKPRYEMETWANSLKLRFLLCTWQKRTITWWHFSYLQLAQAL